MSYGFGIYKYIFGENVTWYISAEQIMSADESAAFEKVFQQRVRRDTAYLVENDFFDLLLDAVVIVLYGTLHHALPGRFVDEGVYDRNLRIPRGLRLDLVVVNHNFGMKDLLVYALVKIVADGTDKHTLRERRDFARRNQAVHLGIEGMAHILPVYRHRLSLLQYLPEPLRKRLGGLADDLPGEDIAHGVHHHRRFLVAIVAFEL